MIDRCGQIWLWHNCALLVLSTRPSTVSDVLSEYPDDLTPLPSIAEHECVDLTEGRLCVEREHQGIPWERREGYKRIL